MKVGLVIAKKEKDLSELKKFILRKNNVDLFIFPEGFFEVNQLNEVSEIVSKSGKWLVTSYSDERKKGNLEVGVVFNRNGKIVGEHVKTTLTKNEIKRGYVSGKSVEIIKTEFGKIGICVCYEMHFPEIAREYKLQGARIIFNPIGTGMYNEEQYRLWTSLGKVRAHENGVYTFGCSHFSDAIPIAYAYDKEGKELLKARDINKLFIVNVPVEKMTKEDDKCSLLTKRTPKLYKHLRR